MKLSRLLLVMTLLLSWQQATAQFEGDVFFDSTDITVLSGDQVTVPTLFFSGPNIFAGVEFEVTFDAAVVELVDVTSPTGDNFTGVFSFHENNPGNFAIVVVNSTSLTEPQGSVPLVNLVFQALGTAGQTTQIQSNVRDSADPNLTRFPTTAGFSATLTVQ